MLLYSDDDDKKDLAGWVRVFLDTLHEECSEELAQIIFSECNLFFYFQLDQRPDFISIRSPFDTRWWFVVIAEDKKVEEKISTIWHKSLDSICEDRVYKPTLEQHNISNKIQQLIRENSNLVFGENMENVFKKSNAETKIASSPSTKEIANYKLISELENKYDSLEPTEENKEWADKYERLAKRECFFEQPKDKEERMILAIMPLPNIIIDLWSDLDLKDTSFFNDLKCWKVVVENNNIKLRKHR